MNPSFFKKLGPININIIKKIINCDTEKSSDNQRVKFPKIIAIS